MDNWIICKHIVNENAEVEIYHEESKTVMCNECHLRISVLLDRLESDPDDIGSDTAITNIMDEVFITMCNEHMIESLKK